MCNQSICMIKLCRLNFSFTWNNRTNIGIWHCRYLQTDSVEITGDSVVQLLYLSKKYLVECLSKVCCTHLCENLDTGNVLQVLELAIMFDEESLIKQCADVLKKHQKKILSCKNFLSLSETFLPNVLDVLQKQGVSKSKVRKIRSAWDSQRRSVCTDRKASGLRTRKLLTSR